MSNNNYLFILTSISENADKAALPLVLANSALSADNDALIWLTLDGVNLAKIGVADEVQPESFAPVKELLDAFIENGGRIGICPPCAATHNLTDENKLENAEWMGGVALLEETQRRQTFTF
ncbi:MAG: DsrE family protein [Gammaproteobacteria bacterium]|nr:DsrE family protein [Gammaproteobacteria bacterium]